MMVKKKQHRRKARLSITRILAGATMIDALLDLANVETESGQLTIPLAHDIRRGVQGAIIRTVRPGASTGNAAADIVGLLTAPELLSWISKRANKYTGNASLFGVRI